MAGVAHRDIKTDNILINPATLQIKVIDFGLATIDDHLDENSQDSRYLGTPYYMAPDILKDFGSHLIVASELWSVGVVFWELLLGYQPFRGAKNKKRLLELTRLEKDFSQFTYQCQSMLSSLLDTREERRGRLEILQDALKGMEQSKKGNSRYAARAKSAEYHTSSSSSSSSSSFSSGSSGESSPNISRRGN